MSQDPLQLKYHMTEFGSIDCVGRSSESDIQDYSHKTTPPDSCFSFPRCQLEAGHSAETFRPTRRWQVHRCKEPRSLNDCVEQSLPPPPQPLPRGISPSMWPGCLRVISPLYVVAGFSKASVPRDQEGSCKGFWNLVLEITESSPLHSTGYKQVTEPAPIQRGDYRRA